MPANAQTIQNYEAGWQAMINQVAKSVVSIQICRPHAFDTSKRSSTEATGFIVDAEQGYILTNRHVIGPGPFWGHCVLDNNEECDIWPVYRDPVHDFGFLRLNTDAVRHMSLTALKLQPEMAQVGVEIRLVGNDAGEKLSILSGVISRLDRNAPNYGTAYNDFNTNYLQASTAAAGGSSGSPVVNLTGHAIGLQAGGSSETTNYFLPLDRPRRTLECLQRDTAITRGTVQTQWLLKTYDDCRRLGLTDDWESAIREAYPDNVNLLVAETVLPEGPSYNKIKEGDILVKVNDQFLISFIILDDILDTSVGEQVHLLVQREGKDHEVTLTVEDLHTITPDCFVTVAGASFHNLSYQQARSYAIACKGLYCCDAQGSFDLGDALSGWLIETVDHKRTPDLDTFIEVMAGIRDRDRVVISYRHISDLHRPLTTVIHLDRHWHTDMLLHTRNDKTGLWNSQVVGKPLPALPLVKCSASFPQLHDTAPAPVAQIIRSFVKVSCYMPVMIDGYPHTRRAGHGIVIDAQKGLILVSRAIVPHKLCDITITVATSVEIEGKVLFLHPFANYTVVQYDPKLVNAPIQTATLSELPIKQGQDTTFVGFDQDDHLMMTKTIVTDVASTVIPADTKPRYRATNLKAILVETTLGNQCSSGALISNDGLVQALWLCYMGKGDDMYHLGLPTTMINPVIKQIRKGVIPEIRSLNIESHVIRMDECRNMGVSESWISKVTHASPFRHQLFKVAKVYAGPWVGEKFQEADIILTINGRIITEASGLSHNDERLNVLVVRKGQETQLQIQTTATSILETSKVLRFCGVTLQKPHHAVLQQISKLHSDVYVSAVSAGSPARQHGLPSTDFVTHVNDVSTPHLDAFAAEVSKIPDNTYFRLHVKTFDNVPRVVTIKTNNHDFGMVQYVNRPGGWDLISSSSSLNYS